MVKGLISILGVQRLVPTHDMGCDEQEVVGLGCDEQEVVGL